MAKLARTVFVTDPDQSGVSLCLQAGQDVPQRLQHLITAPDAWEDGQAPDTEDSDANDKTPDDGEDADAKGAKPAAKKTAAPSRGGRKTAAAEGSGSGQ